jgi:hypothetical protein
MKIEEILLKQKTVIAEQNERLSTLEYILAQTLALTLQSKPDKESILIDMQTFYAEKMLAKGITADSGNKGFETAVRIFTSAAASS